MELTSAISMATPGHVSVLHVHYCIIEEIDKRVLSIADNSYNYYQYVGICMPHNHTSMRRYW